MSYYDEKHSSEIFLITVFDFFELRKRKKIILILLLFSRVSDKNVHWILKKLGQNIEKQFF